MKWFSPIAFLAIGIYGVIQISPWTIPDATTDSVWRIIGSIVWLGIFIGAAIQSAK